MAASRQQKPLAGKIIVDKVTNPLAARPGGSSSTPDSGSKPGTVKLTDAAQPNDSGFLAPATYLGLRAGGHGLGTDERDLLGWQPRHRPSRSPPVRRVTCTFTNTQKGKIIVDKVTRPPRGSTQEFEFDPTGR